MKIIKNIEQLRDIKELNAFILECRSPERSARPRTPEPGDSQDFFNPSATEENSYNYIV